jgi:hypothetical protein
VFVCYIDGGLCDELITRSEESYRRYVSVYDLDTSTIKRTRTVMGCCAMKSVISTLISVQSLK